MLHNDTNPYRELILFSMMTRLAFFLEAAIAVQKPVPEVQPVIAMTLPFMAGKSERYWL